MAMLWLSTEDVFFERSVTKPCVAARFFFAYASLNLSVGLVRTVAPNAVTATARAVAAATIARGTIRFTRLLSERSRSAVTLPAAGAGRRTGRLSGDGRSGIGRAPRAARRRDPGSAAFPFARAHRAGEARA